MRNKFLGVPTKTSIVTETISSGFPNRLMWFRSALVIVCASARSFEGPQGWRRPLILVAPKMTVAARNWSIMVEKNRATGVVAI